MAETLCRNPAQWHGPPLSADTVRLTRAFPACLPPQNLDQRHRADRRREQRKLCQMRLPEAGQQKTNQVQVELAAALAKRRRSQSDQMNELRTASPVH